MSKAKHDNSRRVASAATQGGRTPQRRDISPSADPRQTGALPLNLIDLSRHPDAALLKACAEATKLRDRFDSEGVEPFRDPAPPGANDLWRLTLLITNTEAMTPIGLQTKAIYVMGDEADLMNRMVAVAPFASVIRDFLRMAVVS